MKNKMKCKECGGKEFCGIEYAYPHPESYDGISEWRCIKCGARFGRWTGKKLKGDEHENRYGRS